MYVSAVSDGMIVDYCRDVLQLTVHWAAFSSHHAIIKVEALDSRLNMSRLS